jgi:hypothetical protein
MYQELGSALLLRGQEQERERFRTRIDRLRQLERGDATGPGWRSPAAVIEREPGPARERSRGPSFWEWALAMRLAGTKS